MENEIISYLEMCQREGVSLQQGMNFRLSRIYSVILMSVRPNAPYRDDVLDDGGTLIYEGHDVPRTSRTADPKAVDQPEFTLTGQLAQNGKFHKAAQECKKGLRSPEPVHVYEKIRAGIWSYNGLFHLVDSWQESDGRRLVFKFKLVVADEAGEHGGIMADQQEPRRVIPTSVKLQVWKRDEGKCVICGAKDELHFDHVVRYSRISGPRCAGLFGQITISGSVYFARSCRRKVVDVSALQLSVTSIDSTSPVSRQTPE